MSIVRVSLVAQVSRKWPFSSTLQLPSMFSGGVTTHSRVALCRVILLTVNTDYCGRAQFSIETVSLPSIKIIF